MPSETMSQVLRTAQARISSSPNCDLHPGQARSDSLQLLESVLGHEPGPSEMRGPLGIAKHRRFERLVERRFKGEPVALIIGWIEFRGLKLRVRPGIFVPRYTSEFAVAQALTRLRRRRSPIAVDLATGIGPIALGIAHGLQKGRCFGTDLSKDAVAMARRNATINGLSGKTKFFQGSLFDALPRGIQGKVDLVVFHPPYVARGEVKDLPAEVRRFEPASTLTDRSPDGLGLVRAAVEQGQGWIRPGGWLLVEISGDLARSVSAMMRRGGYQDVVSRRDSWGYTRVVAGRLR